MFSNLSDLTVVEAASFVAGPSCGLHLVQMGARVIRVDPLRGGPDFHRWPLAAGGQSLFWEGLNRGKLSICLDLSRPEGRELAQALIAAPGPGRGLFITNQPESGYLSHAGLSVLRADLISLRIQGWPDGRNAVDYTINAALGVPFLNGPEDLDPGVPVNSVIPVWDLQAGALAAFQLLAAERQRRLTGTGAELEMALSDVASTTLANLGMLAEVQEGGDRSRSGNALFGAFGRDFICADGRRVMIVAITPRQWMGLLAALDVTAQVATLEAELGISFATDEGNRFQHRHRLFDLIEAAVSLWDFPTLAAQLDRQKVCWEPYQTIAQALGPESSFRRNNPVFAETRQASGMTYAAPGPAIRMTDAPRGTPAPAPVLGQDAEQVLGEVLGLTTSEIADLHDRGIVG